MSKLDINSIRQELIADLNYDFAEQIYAEIISQKILLDDLDYTDRRTALEQFVEAYLNEVLYITLDIVRTQGDYELKGEVTMVGDPNKLSSETTKSLIFEMIRRLLPIVEIESGLNDEDLKTRLSENLSKMFLTASPDLGDNFKQELAELISKIPLKRQFIHKGAYIKILENASTQLIPNYLIAVLPEVTTETPIPPYSLFMLRIHAYLDTVINLSKGKLNLRSENLLPKLLELNDRWVGIVSTRPSVPFAHMDLAISEEIKLLKHVVDQATQIVLDNVYRAVLHLAAIRILVGSDTILRNQQAIESFLRVTNLTLTGQPIVRSLLDSEQFKTLVSDLKTVEISKFERGKDQIQEQRVVEGITSNLITDINREADQQIELLIPQGINHLEPAEFLHIALRFLFQDRTITEDILGTIREKVIMYMMENVRMFDAVLEEIGIRASWSEFLNLFLAKTPHVLREREINRLSKRPSKELASAYLSFVIDVATGLEEPIGTEEA